MELGLLFDGLKPQNRGQTGSRYVQLLSNMAMFFRFFSSSRCIFRLQFMKPTFSFRKHMIYPHTRGNFLTLVPVDQKRCGCFIIKYVCQSPEILIFVVLGNSLQFSFSNCSYFSAVLHGTEVHDQRKDSNAWVDHLSDVFSTYVKVCVYPNEEGPEIYWFQHELFLRDLLGKFRQDTQKNQVFGILVKKFAADDTAPTPNQTTENMVCRL